MNKNTAISLKNISKVYKLYNKPVDRLKESLHPFRKKYHKDFYALRNINLEVKKGEVLGIVGVNGAGKSTLLKIISGVICPTTGRVNIHGRINAILELGGALKPEMTGRENIKLNLQINGIEENREEITQDIIAFADIGEHINQPIKSYSSGMKARLGFAIATSTDPDILIVDEVLAVGDVLFQRKCYAKIDSLFKDGKTVIFVSHNSQSVIEFCSRAVLLYDREIILDDSPKNVIDSYQKLMLENEGKNKICDNVSDDTTQEQDISNINLKFFEFYDLNIKNKEDMVTNNLITNEKYTVEFFIKSRIAADDLSVGCQIRTIKGVIVSGANTRDFHNETLPHTCEGEVLKINMSFCNYLLPGKYYFVLSITAKNQKKSVKHHEQTFTVEQNNFIQGGYVTLQQKFY